MYEVGGAKHRDGRAIRSLRHPCLGRAAARLDSSALHSRSRAVGCTPHSVVRGRIMIRRTRVQAFVFFVIALTATRAPAADPAPVVLVQGRFGKALDARAAPVHFDGDERYRRAPLTVERWAKLFSKKGANILVACDSRDSAQHWEIRSDAGSGAFTAFLPSCSTAEIKSEVDICDKQWHYLAMSFDGTTVRLFVDGKRVASQVVSYKDGLKPKPGP